MASITQMESGWPITSPNQYIYHRNPAPKAQESCGRRGGRPIVRDRGNRKFAMRFLSQKSRKLYPRSLNLAVSKPEQEPYQ